METHCGRRAGRPDLLLLTATIGLPYMVLAATSPLLQSWFFRVHPGKSPYRLYAVSNVGSLLALVSYPFVFEPLITRRIQAYAWSGGLVIYAGLVLACGLHLWRQADAAAGPAASIGPLESSKSKGKGTAGKAATATPEIRPSLGVQALWLGFSACASMVLLGTTNQLCQNVAVVPFLWVLPLSLYLLTFIFCFERTALYPRWFFTLLLIPMLALLSLNLAWRENSVAHQIIIYCGGLFVCGMECHGELYRLRPSPQSLTQFYLMIAAGGALGGAIVAVVAPRVFLSYAELNWSLCLLGLLLLIVHQREGSAWALGRRRWPLWPVIGVVTVALATALTMQSQRGARRAVAMTRSFFGVSRVQEVSPDEPLFHGYSLKHGSIQHGAQFVDFDS